MATSRQFHILFSAVFLLMLVKQMTATICQKDVCKCQSATTSTYVGSIECICNSEQDLDFTQSEFQGVSFGEVTTLKVSNCGSVAFRKNALSSLTKLYSMNVQNVNKVTFEVGVFEQLGTLDLQHVRKLEFAKNAFNSAHGLKSIQIMNSNLPELSEYTLYKIDGFQRMTLTGVTIDNVRKNALNLAAPTVFINNCTIKNIEEGGIVLNTRELSITEAVLNKLEANALTITSSEDMLIARSKFEDRLPSNAMRITTPSLNISSNSFKFFPAEMLANMNLTNNGEAIFTGNTVSELELGVALLNITSGSRRMQIYANKLPCLCKYLELAGSIPGFARFGDNNFCIADCRISVTEATELIKNRRVCDNGKELDSSTLCANKPTTTTSTPPSVLHTTRQGKDLNPTAKPKTKPATSSSDTIRLVPSIILISLSITIFNHLFC